MKLCLPFKSILLFVVVFILFSVFLINPGYFDRIYASFYNKISNSCSYCESDGHGFRYCPKKAVINGALGRWVIPDVGVNVACYVASNSDNAQKITDATDSAALIRKTNATLLADHNYQGFNVIKKCEIGTIAYMYIGTVTEKYVCTKVFEGYNSGAHLTDLNGNVVEFNDSGGYTIYTCHFFNDRITIVHFAPVTGQL